MTQSVDEPAGDQPSDAASPQSADATQEAADKTPPSGLDGVPASGPETEHGVAPHSEPGGVGAAAPDHEEHEPIGAPEDRFEPALDQIADGSRSREGYAVHLTQFEGPLDLLLHLVRRHELDVLDIPIHFVASKYLEYVKFASALDIELAGEYLVMAATLAYLKSRELLPSMAQEADESVLGEDGVDPRDELIRRLVEYERFRAAAASLDALPITGRDTFGRGGELGIVVPPPDLAPITLFRLADAFSRVLERARVLQEHQVEIEPITVRQRMEQLALLLIETPKLSLESLFLERVWRNERELRQVLVVTLMSILELVKLGVLGVEQGEGSDHVSIERVGELDSLKAAVEGYREDEEDAAAAAAASPTELGESLAQGESVEPIEPGEAVHAGPPAANPTDDDDAPGGTDGTAGAMS